MKLASKVGSADGKRPLGRDPPSVLADGGCGAAMATGGAAVTPDAACGRGLPPVAALGAAPPDFAFGARRERGRVEAWVERRVQLRGEVGVFGGERALVLHAPV